MVQEKMFASPSLQLLQPHGFAPTIVAQVHKLFNEKTIYCYFITRFHACLIHLA